ncbi:unnamed protein product, partial [Neisseria lactamica Y92-1009]
KIELKGEAGKRVCLPPPAALPKPNQKAVKALPTK